VPVEPPARRRPAHERGRFGRLALGLADHVRTAWWGLVAPRISEREPLGIVQAVVLRTAPGAAEGGAAEEVLLTLRSDLFGWELPGGTPEEGELFAAALVREVKEETGLEVVLGAEVGAWTRRGFRPHTAYVHRAKVIGGSESPSDETPRVAWFSVDALPEGLLPWYAEPIAVALSGGEGPVRRTEWQGMRSIWTALRIDLGMRWRGLP